MMSKKNRKRAIATLVLLTYVPLAAAADDTLSGDYFARYQSNVTNYCENNNLLGSKDRIAHPLLKDPEPPYLDLGGSNGTSQICTGTGMLNLFGQTSAVDMGSCLYRETMNALYGCAVLQSKKTILTNLATLIQDQGGGKDVIQKVKQMIQDVNQELQTGGKCTAEVSSTDELSLKGILLDNSIYQHCKYRFYLEYLDRTMTYDTSKIFIKDGKPTETIPASIPTTAAVRFINATKNSITNQIDHSRAIQSRALDAFSEFERTYGLHVVLIFVYSEYVEMRKNLKALLNPIGQVTYKISNAQSPKDK